MKSSDEDQYGDSPISVSLSPIAVSTEVGEFIFPSDKSRKTTTIESPKNEYRSLLLNQTLEDISLDQGSAEVKVRKERISIDSTDSSKTDNEEIDLFFASVIEQKQRLEAITTIIEKESTIDPIPEPVDQPIVNSGMSKEAREAIAMIEQKFIVLTMQLNAMEQQRQYEIRESALLESQRQHKRQIERHAEILSYSIRQQEILESENIKKDLQAQVDRVGY